MGFDVTARGLRIVLDAEVPTMVERYLREDVDEFLADHGLTRADIGWWVCHPGGPKVIEALEAALEVPREAVRLTWESLARVGNLSSASVLHVLEDTLRERPPAPGTHGVLLAMGPGLLLRAGAAAGGGLTLESLVAFTVLVALVGARAAGRARRVRAQRRLEPRARRRRDRPGPLPVHGACCTPGCSSARSWRPGYADPTCPPGWPGR